MTGAQYSLGVTPSSASTAVWTERRCIYSVSIGAANRTVDDILDGLVWTMEHFPEVAVLVGDSLYALTLRIQRGLDEASALQAAFAAASETVRRLEEKAGNLEFFRTSRIAPDPRFVEIEEQLDLEISATPDFARSILDDARLFVGRQAKNNRLALQVEVAESLARRYLVREIGTYAYLASLGWRVDTYLGQELPTLARIMNGSIPVVSRHLANRINISLIRKDKSR